jgi:hypothetical protein
MVPENEQALLMARWKLKDAQDIQKAIKKGLLSEEQVEHAEEVLDNLYDERRAEGMPKSQALWAEYIATRLQGESYADWYRRTKLLPERLAGRPLPGPDWCGFSPMVDLEDIKLKIVQQEGKNTYDYDIWPDDIREATRRPFLEEAAQELREAPTQQDPNEIRMSINKILAANNIRGANIILTPINGLSENVVDIKLEDDRAVSSRELIRRSNIG